jgi:PTS system mannitol-specific IIC component
MALLTRIAHVVLDSDQVERLRSARTREEIHAVLASG